MTDLVPWLLWSWVVLTALLFRFLPGRDAAIVGIVLGWAFLPVAPFPLSSLVNQGQSSWWPALAIPTASFLNKGTAIGLGCLSGLLLFDRRALDRIKLDWVDLPIIVWCLVPLFSGPANALALSDGLGQVRYLTMTWGVPYLMGRIYLADVESQARFGVAQAAGGLAYLPICLLENFRGPSVYRVLYGPHPYEFEGTARSIGYRPLVFLEHGNQLGIWMAGSALVATWIWASGAVKKPGGIPGGLLAGLLIGSTLLCQSSSSVIFLILGLSPLLISRFLGRKFSWKWAGAILLGLAILAVGLEGARRGFDPRAIREDVARFFRGINKKSFTWRLARTEDFLPVALQRPWLGWGREDWRTGGQPFLNPVNLPLELLAFGMFGGIGLVAVLAVWIVPLIQQGRRWSPSMIGPGRGATGALVALVTIHFLDSFSNATVILPVLAAVGGLTRPRRGS